MDIKATIKRQGFTIGEVCKKLDISRASFSQYVNGNPTIETLRKIANIIGCNVTDFFADETPINRERQETTQTMGFNCPVCGAKYEITIKSKDD